MIDTIVLMLPDTQFRITEHEKFSPSTKGLFERPFYRLGGRGNFSCYQNPTKTELKQGIYKPRLTVSKRIRKGGFGITLRVELSLPKLLYSNNFDELTDQNFKNILPALHDKLSRMGIDTTLKALREAPVSAVHYSKNVVLENYVTCSMILNDLKKVNLKESLDLNQTDFRNEGKALRYHANSYEVVLYDKIKDLEQARKSEKRSQEEDTAIQMNLFEHIEQKRNFEVLRIEIRLGKKQKIRQILKKIGIEKEPTFELMFSQKISQQILCGFWEDVEGAVKFLNFQVDEPIELLEVMLKNNPELKTAKALQLFSALFLGKNAGIRRLRNTLGLTGKKSRNWYRLQKELRELKLPEMTKYHALLEVKEQLTKFKPLRLPDFGFKPYSVYLYDPLRVQSR